MRDEGSYAEPWEPGDVMRAGAAGSVVGQPGKLVETRARVEGLLVRDFENRFEEANERLARWVNEGTIE
jgi:NADPH-dependent curcumin reductase CurA